MLTGIESIAAIAAAQPAGAATSAANIDATAGYGTPSAFARIMQQQLGELNSSIGTAETAMRDLAAGKPVELHEVMIALEHARVSVQTFVQIRNKLIESYQDLIRMQL
jgi:flagellar hook-basal body complex protein FliE